MKWTETFYQPVFGPHGEFRLSETGKTARRCTAPGGRALSALDDPTHSLTVLLLLLTRVFFCSDYTFGERKFGGNAQYISKSRWLHHTSFLWDYDSEKMRCLKHPPKEPVYREKRSHEDFILRLSETMPSRGAFLDSVQDQLREYFDPHTVTLEQARSAADRGKGPALKSTKLIDL